MSVAFLPLGILLVSIDFFITLITFQWVGILKKLFLGKQVRSVPVGDDPSHRVMPDFKGDLLKTPVQGAATLYDLTKVAFEKYASRPCIGTRPYLGWYNKPKVKKFGTDITWLTFGEVGTRVYKFGAALRAAGVVPAPTTTSLDKFDTSRSLAIFEDTCPEWMIAAQGSFTQSIIVTTIYATLGMDAVVDSVNDGLISVLVCNKKNVTQVISKIALMPTLKTIVWTDFQLAPDDVVDVPTQTPKGITVVSFDDFVESGDPVKYPPTPPKGDTMAVVMYTSGSTGKPKGVVITHSQIVASMASGCHLFGVVPEDVYMCYLPLAHIMELMAEFLFLSMGCRLVYADPKTLTSKGSYPVGALEAFAPSLMVGVPKVWDSVKKGVEAKIAAESPLKQFLIKTAFDTRRFANKWGYDTPLFNKLVFKKFKMALGGNMRLAISGGGPLNAEVQHFTSTMFSMPLIQGYGLTETNGALTIQDLEDDRAGIAGVPVPSIEIKLVSTVDVVDRQGKPYLTTDRVDHEGNPVFGRGEIVARGHNIATGYYLMEDKTKEVFEKDTGFFYTGDIGQFMNDGSVRIVDRKKNLVKLKGGEYIAVENMEMIYGNSVFVDAAEGGICCYGDGDMDRPIALMQLNEAYTMKWAIDHKEEGSFEDLKKSQAVYDAVMASMKTEANKGKLTRLENLVAVVFMPKSWTPENGCLTAANKLQRKTVITMFEKEFEETKKKGIF